MKKEDYLHRSVWPIIRSIATLNAGIEILENSSSYNEKHFKKRHRHFYSNHCYLPSVFLCIHIPFIYMVTPLTCVYSTTPLSVYVSLYPLPVHSFRFLALHIFFAEMLETFQILVVIQFQILRRGHIFTGVLKFVVFPPDCDHPCFCS